MDQNKLIARFKEIRNDADKYIELLEEIYSIKLYFYQKIIIKKLWKRSKV